MEGQQIQCRQVRRRLFPLLDGELPGWEGDRLQAHFEACPSCAWEWKILTLPRRIGRSIPALEPSPFFYARLQARIEREAESITIWQILLGLSRPIVPALATITLVILSLFAYFEYQGPRLDLYQAYDSIFIPGDRDTRMVIAEEITEESVIRALAEKPAGRSRTIQAKQAR